MQTIYRGHLTIINIRGFSELLHADQLSGLQKSSEYKLNCINAIEIYGSKINALLNRAAAYSMIRFKLFDEMDIPQLLFDDPDIIKRIENHPMVLWKTIIKRRTTILYEER